MENTEVVEHTEVERIGVGVVVVLVPEGRIVPELFVEHIVVGTVQVKEEDIEPQFVLVSCELLVVVEEEEALHKLLHQELEQLLHGKRSNCE